MNSNTAVSGGVPRIGICLSGGGFRASFYALGVLRYLAEADVLKEVVGVSAVSGGSLAAAALAECADEWTANSFLDRVDRPFRHVVTSKNLRNRWLGRTLWSRFRRPRIGRGVVLGEVLADHLFATRRLRDLPAGPQVILTATDLTTGRAFRMARDFVGSYDFGYVEPPPAAIELGLAVAASAAIPVLFAPVSLATADLGLERAPDALFLADGGVYDNLGLEWFQGWDSGRPASSEKADFLVVVNAGGLLHHANHSFGGLRALWRAKDVQYSQTTKLRTRWFVRDLLASRTQGMYLGIGLDPREYRLPDGSPVDPLSYEGALPSDLIAPIAGIRTDLDRFLPEEADVISYHAYWSTHARLASLYPRLAVSAPDWREFADLPSTETARLRRLLLSGAKRLRLPRFSTWPKGRTRE